MKLSLKSLFLMFIALLSVFPFYLSAQVPPRFNLSLGNSVRIESKVLNETRDIFIHLPDSYRLTKDKYPVLYILDGENNFNFTVANVQFLNRIGKIPEMIVVGIPNTSRNRDFTPVKVPELPLSGGGDNFLSFLKDELIPRIDNEYRTNRYRILEGHSLCGMFAFYTMFKEPELFNAYIAVSPWVIHNNNFIVDYVKSSLEKKIPGNKIVYFSAGSLELPDFLTTLNSFVDMIKSRAPENLQWKYELIENEDHGSVLPPTVHRGLMNLYKDWELPETAIRSGLASIMDHYKKLSSKFGYEIEIPEFLLNAAGYSLIRNGLLDKAVEVFKKNVELYPLSPNTHDSLGEAFERSNQPKLALECYRQAYKLARESNDINLETFKSNYERTAKQVSSN
ncbi:MAG: alpha/beta hydrolase-fold protein [Bacillota bacterium]